MDIHFNFIVFLDSIALIQGVLLGLILINSSGKKKPSLFLGLFLITYSLELIDSIIVSTGILIQKQELLFFPFNFYYLTVPLLYLYVKRLTMPILLKNVFNILIPGLVEILIFSFLFLLPTKTKQNIEKSEYFDNIMLLYLVFSIVFSICFAFITIKLIQKHKKRVLEYYSNVENLSLNWAKKTAIFIIIFYSIWIVVLLFPISNNTDLIIRSILSVINVGFIYWVGIYGLKQSKVNFGYPKKAIKKVKITLNHNEKISITNNTALFNELIELMNSKKLYKNPKLNLSMLAEKLGTSREKLSQLINQNAQVNFNHFVNQYRIDKAKLLLCDNKFNNLNMLGIALEVGFNSRATFFSVFKKIVGISPNVYKKRNGVANNL